MIEKAAIRRPFCVNWAAQRGLTVLALAEYAGGFVEQYNLLWRKEFGFDPFVRRSVCAVRQRGCYISAGQTLEPDTCRPAAAKPASKRTGQAGRPGLRQFEQFEQLVFASRRAKYTVERLP
jgi:hypothetical protein